MGLPVNADSNTNLTIFPSHDDPLPQSAGFGSNVMIASDGKVVIYTGANFYWLADAEAMDPAHRIESFDVDGLGRDFLTSASHVAIGARESRLAVSGPSGLYYAKNVTQGGLPEVFIFRLNRLEDGTFRRIPIATIPRGNVATSIHWHMGSLLLMCSSDFDQLIPSDGETFRTDLWQVSPFWYLFTGRDH